MNIFIKKHSSILLIEKNEAAIRRRRIITNLQYKKISNKLFNLILKSNYNNNNIVIKTVGFNFSTNNNFLQDEIKNSNNNLSYNPSLSAEKPKTDFNFNLNLTDDKKINFDAFYDKMKENIDSLVEMNKKLKETSEM